MRGLYQQTVNIDTSILLLPKGIKLLQSKLEISQYCTQIIDCTTLPGVNEISLLQTKATSNTNKLIYILFDYACANLDTKLIFYKCNMILKAHSGSFYLLVINSRSRATEYFCIGDDMPLNKIEDL